MPEAERYSQERALEEAVKMKELVDAGQDSSYAEAEARIENQSLDKKQEFERITGPEELLSFMKEKINYGFVGKNKKVYAHDNEKMNTDFEAEYYLQSPEELLESGQGVCWDSVELERRWFLEHSFKPEVYFMMYAKEGGTDLPTHTFLVFEKDNKWHWFEHSFGDQRGIHEYASRGELLDDVKKKHHDYAVQNRGATNEDFARLRVMAYEKPDFGSSPQEFISNIFKQNPQ
jgi:hypothetical protein